MASTSEPGIYTPFPSFDEWNLEGLATEDFDSYAELLAQAKLSADRTVLEGAMESARRYAAVDTNAIEGLYEVDRGFTRTVATQAAAWEAMMEARGPHVRPAFDDALNGYEYVLDAATESVDLSEKWIKEIHQIICASQDTYRVYTPAGPQDQPLPKGIYKSMPNSPTLLDGRVHAYASVIDTAPEMRRLMMELRTEKFLEAHPVVQAAYAHYAYVCIHPFADGNGRVARALSSVYLYRFPGIPLIVFADQRNEYYDSLERADNGNPNPFIRFIATRAIDAMNLVRTMLQNIAPPVAETLSSLNELFDSGLQDDELVAAAIRLRAMALEEAKKQMQDLPVPEALRLSTNKLRFRNAPQPPPGYADIGEQGSWNFVATSSFPKRVNVFVHVGTFAKSSPDAASELLMATNPGDGLEVWMREIAPAASETLKLKLSAWTEAKIAELLEEVRKQAAKI